MTDRECLEYIRDHYGVLLAASASGWGHRPEVLAGIMCRETRGGTSPLLDMPGANGCGDNGHGHGLMQIDDRSFPDFCESGRWRDPAANIEKAAEVLFEKTLYLSVRAPKYHLIPADIERASIAAYNCGQGNVIRALDAGYDLDYYTAHQDYSKKVLEYAAIYASLEVDHLVPPAVTVPPPSARRNILSSIWNLFRSH